MVTHKPIVKIKYLDHIVFNVSDMDSVLDFYINILGLIPERLELFRLGEAPFPSVRVNDTTIIDFFPIGQADSRSTELKQSLPSTKDINHLCFTVSEIDMSHLMMSLKAKNITVVEGPVQRFGAQGNATSIYIQDPEGRIIELRCY